MSKQDRSRVRSAEDLERKYNFTAMKKAIELNELGLNKTNTEMENFVDSVLGSLDNMQNQIDGKVDTYYYNGVPSLDTLPASEWAEEDYKSHVGDQYYDKDTGTAYKFTYNSDTDSYSWTQINDSAAMEALAIANAAKDTADSKRTVFTSQPYPPYSNGDLWIKNKELYVCQISRDTGEIFYENDFIVATKYTDDTYAIGVEKDLTVLSGTVTEIQTDVAFYKVTVEQQTEIVNSLGETVKTLGEKQAQLEVTADKINWIVADGTDASNFTMTSGAVNIMTDALGIDALVEFKNSAENGTSTVINGGAIDTDSLFSREIYATDLHISGNSSFEGDVICNESIVVKSAELNETVSMSIEKVGYSTPRFSLTPSVDLTTGEPITRIEWAANAKQIPSLVVESGYGLYVETGLQCPVIHTNSIYTQGMLSSGGATFVNGVRVVGDITVQKAVGPQGQKYNGTITSEGNIYLGADAEGIFTGGKTTYGEGKEGVHIRKNGRIYMEGGNVTPGLYFYHGGQTSNGANIVYDSTDDYLKFNGATRYTFDKRVDVSGSVVISGGYYTNGKTSAGDGVTGAVLAATGRLFLTGGEGTDYQNPYICFYKKGSTTDDAYISYQAATDYLAFGGATRYTFDARVQTSGSFVASVGVFSGGKTSSDDGVEGCMFSSNGNLHLQNNGTDTNPCIYFYGNKAKNYGGYISGHIVDDYLYFGGFSSYLFSNILRATSLRSSGSVYAGYGESYSTGHAFYVPWKDGSNHALAYRGEDGLTAYFGWAGSSSYSTVGILRGRTVKYSNSSGTTTLSDERLKKDFTSLAEWDRFFDAIEPCAFRMKAGNSGRFHMGFKAKQIEDALLANGMTTKDFAGFIRMSYQPDADDPEGNAIYAAAGILPGDDELGLVYTEFTALNTYQIQNLKAEVKLMIQSNATEHMAMNELMHQMLDMIQDQQRQINDLTSLLAQQ